MYAVHKQCYLEYLERREIQHGFTYLTKRIKPFEAIIPADEMRDLCYVLTCRSVQDAPSFRNWLGDVHRTELLEQLETLLEFETPSGDLQRVPPKRLQTLLKQAVAYQMATSNSNTAVPPPASSTAPAPHEGTSGVDSARAFISAHSTAPSQLPSSSASAPSSYPPSASIPATSSLRRPELKTLMSDYCGFAIPDTVQHKMMGHTANVKCISFVGPSDDSIISGSSDATLRLWQTDTGEHLRTFEGHASRIWDVCATNSGEHVLSASADATVKLWSTADGQCVRTFTGHAGDVYSVKMHPDGSHVVTGGYDQSVRLFDVRTGAEVKTFNGHTLGVSGSIFNNHGNLIISGSKDCSVKVWDLASGLCVKTLEGEFAQITSVDLDAAGYNLLVATKSSTNALVDLRMGRVVKRFRGHQNSSRHFIRAVFGPTDEMVMGGSEDGSIYIWDVNTAEVDRVLQGHEDVVYQPLWSSARGVLASCSDDRSIICFKDTLANSVTVE